jgi:thiol-disulfide isomerase/thioredoxin
MRRAVMAMLALWALTGLPAVGASDDPNKVQDQSQKTPKEQFQAVVDAYQQAQKDYSQAYSKAKTKEERKTVSEKRPKDEEFAHRFLAIADAAPDDPAAVDALLWYIRLIRPGDTSKAMRRLAEKYAADPRLARFVVTLTLYHSPSAEALLRAVIEKNRDRTARGNATMALARSLSRRVDLIARLREDDQDAHRIEQLLATREGFDEAALARLKATDCTALVRESESLFERVVKEFGDINDRQGTLGKQAASALNEIHNLGIGKPCPEIVGEDIDGKPFQLGDYRGKVIVIAFWGDWCGPCREMYPHERSLVKKMEGKPFVLLGVNSDRDKQTLHKRMQQENITWRFWWDGGGISGPIANQFNIQGWPTLYVVDHRGIIRHKWMGIAGQEKFDPAIEKLVAAVPNDSKNAK